MVDREREPRRRELNIERVALTLFGFVGCLTFWAWLFYLFARLTGADR